MNLRSLKYYLILALVQFQITWSSAQAFDNLKQIPEQEWDSHCRVIETSLQCRAFKFNESTAIAHFELPNATHIGITVLKFRNSEFINTPLNLFSCLPNLVQLNIGFCEVRFIHAQSFLKADKLERLFLTYNQIEIVRNYSFRHASGLQYLDLSLNKLNTLEPHAFATLKALERLELSWNKLVELPKGIFDDLTALKLLRLDNNRLRHISSGLFAPLNLNSLSLISNDLTEFVLNSENPLKATEVYIGGNAQLSDLMWDNTDVKLLIANNCNLTRVHFHDIHPAFHCFLTKNRLLNLTFAHPEHLKVLDLHDVNLGNVDFLEKAVNLELLDLSHNPNLSALPSSWIAVSLQGLDLRNSSISNLSFLATAANLLKIDLSDNHNLDWESFPTSWPAVNLLELRMSNTGARNVNFLEKTLKLEELDVSENPNLAPLPTSWPAVSLIALDLSNTSLLELPTEVLTQAKKLISLDLSHNQLQHIDQEQAKRLKSIKHLKLNENPWACEPWIQDICSECLSFECIRKLLSEKSSVDI